MKKGKKIKLILKDGAEYEGLSFGADSSTSGEVVFATGMVGYPEALTDPSFCGQILVLTYPLIGNYGIPKKEFWESERIQVSGLVACNYVETFSHHGAAKSLGEWLKEQGVPAIEIKDTRGLTQKLRTQGVMPGKIVCGKDETDFEDINEKNLVAQVSSQEVRFAYPSLDNNPNNKAETIVLIDCGVKRNIIRSLVSRGHKVAIVPWDTDVTQLPFDFKAVVISNGPGDPKKVQTTINNAKKIVAKGIPVLGICLGNQILALATGGSTYKLKFGHRSQNQPAILSGTNKCYLSTQNHGFAVDVIPKGFREWFTNANDKTNEGIIHESLPIMSVQFHPESSPGPLDTDWIFDYFLEKANLHYKVFFMEKKASHGKYRL